MEDLNTIKNIEDLVIISTKVLVQIEKLKQGTIELPSEVLQREQDKITKGIFLKAGPIAFMDLYDPGEPVKKQVPHKGDTVYFVKYAGKALTVDGKEYRVIQDDDIYAFQRKEKLNDE